MRGGALQAGPVDLLNGFSCPHEHIEKGLIDALAIGRAVRLCSIFLDQKLVRDTVPKDILTVLEGWSTGHPAFEAAWSGPFELLQEALRGESMSLIEEAAVAGAIACHAAGMPGSWNINLMKPGAFRWGSLQLPTADYLSIRSDGATAFIKNSLGGADELSLRVERAGKVWNVKDLKGSCSRLPTLPLSNGEFITVSPEPLPESFDEKGAPVQRVDYNATEESVLVPKEALDLLGNHSSIYYAWVSRLIRKLVPVVADKGLLTSASYDRRPGVVAASYRVNPEAFAEMLSHEASHQHWYLLTSAWGVVDGSDNQLYYSPAKDQPRPLYNILLAYHAFGNVLLMLDSLVESRGFDTPFTRRRRRELPAQLEMLEAPLRTSRGITEAGHCIWQPISERVRDLRNPTS